MIRMAMPIPAAATTVSAARPGVPAGSLAGPGRLGPGSPVTGRLGRQGREVGGLAGRRAVGPAGSRAGISPVALVSLLIVPWRSVRG